jgi:hypothetical protein
MPGGETARIVVSEEFKDVAEEDHWPAMIKWLIEWHLRLRAALDAVAGAPNRGRRRRVPAHDRSPSRLRATVAA